VVSPRDASIILTLATALAAASAIKRIAKERMDAAAAAEKEAYHAFKKADVDCSSAEIALAEFVRTIKP
jgi:hypothetical protein